MKRRYIALTQLRICVGEKSFEFDTFDGGQSIFETEDPEEMDIIESHNEFRHTFDIDETLELQQQARAAAEAKRREDIEAKRKQIEEEKIKAQQEHFAAMKRDAAELEERPAENTPTVEKEVTDDGFTIVEAQSINDAKDYMKEKFGIPKSKIMKLSDLLDRAREHKIKFTGKDF